MKLPSFLSSEHNQHQIEILAAVCFVLLVSLFILLWPQAKRLLLVTITPISQEQPVSRLSLISPAPNSTVSSKAPLVFTISNNPKIIEAKLLVDGNQVQTVFFQETDKLTIYWDTEKTPDGIYKIEAQVKDTQNQTSAVTSTFSVKNNVYNK